jgi:hypothetical protein
MKTRAVQKTKKESPKTKTVKSVKKPAKKSIRAPARTAVAKKVTSSKKMAKKVTSSKKMAKGESPPTKAILQKLDVSKTTTPTAPKLQPEPVTPPPELAQGCEQLPAEEAPLATTPPVFLKRELTGPDGSKRPGWEMWIGDHCFGRADNKDLLLASFERLQSPPSSFHWREVRNRMPMRGRPRNAPGQKAPRQAMTSKQEKLPRGLEEEAQEIS